MSDERPSLDFQLSYDRITLNSWLRYYDRYELLVHECVRFNATFCAFDDDEPILVRGSFDEETFERFLTMRDRCGMREHARGSSVEIELLGEVYAFWDWDEAGPYGHKLLNPDRVTVDVDASGADRFHITPWKVLKDVVNSDDPEIVEKLKAIDPELLKAVRDGDDVTLDLRCITAVAMRSAPYELRGISPILPVLKDLLYLDRLRSASPPVIEQAGVDPVASFEWSYGRIAIALVSTDGSSEPDWSRLRSRFERRRGLIAQQYRTKLLEPFAKLIGSKGIPEIEWRRKVDFAEPSDRESYMARVREIAKLCKVRT